MTILFSMTTTFLLQEIRSSQEHGKRMQIPRENRDTGNKIILLLIIFAVSVQEENIKTVGYDFVQVVGTTVYSLTDQKKCTRGSSEMASVPRGSVVFSDNDGRRERKTCHYQASDTVSYIKNHLFMMMDCIYMKNQSLYQHFT